MQGKKSIDICLPSPSLIKVKARVERGTGNDLISTNVCHKPCLHSKVYKHSWIKECQAHIHPERYSEQVELSSALQHCVQTDMLFSFP